MYLHFIVLPDRHGPDSVLGPQLLGEGSGHEAPPDVGGGRKVPLPRLGPVRGDVLIQFHLLKISRIICNFKKYIADSLNSQIETVLLCSMWWLFALVWHVSQLWSFAAESYQHRERINRRAIQTPHIYWAGP